MRGMMGSKVLVNILKPVNIVNLGNTLRCGVGIFWSCKPYFLTLVRFSSNGWLTINSLFLLSISSSKHIFLV